MKLRADTNIIERIELERSAYYELYGEAPEVIELTEKELKELIELNKELQYTDQGLNTVVLGMRIEVV